MKKATVLTKILCKGILPIVVPDTLPPMKCLEALMKSGVEAVEVSCRNPKAGEIIKEGKKEFPEMAIGAASLIEDGLYRKHLVNCGNVVPTIDEMIELGSDFLVSLLPFRAKTYEKYSKEYVIISGVATAGEAQQALDFGANFVKFVNLKLSGGPDYFKGIDPASHRGFPFFVSGGMTPDNIPGYVEAKVLVFGAGFDMILNKDYESMKKNFDGKVLLKGIKAYVDAIAAARRIYMKNVPFESRDIKAIIKASGRCLNV